MGGGGLPVTVETVTLTRLARPHRWPTPRLLACVQ